MLCFRSFESPEQRDRHAFFRSLFLKILEQRNRSGETWEEATITQEAGPYSWVRFEHDWDAQAGTTTLASRATDNRALTQPLDVPWNAKGYGMNAIYSFDVTVE